VSQFNTTDDAIYGIEIATFKWLKKNKKKQQQIKYSRSVFLRRTNMDRIKKYIINANHVLY